MNAKPVQILFLFFICPHIFSKAFSESEFPVLRTVHTNSCSSRPFSYSYQHNINLTEIGICAYYDDVVRIFQAADPVALSKLFDDNITRPMNKRDIFTWAKDFFTKNGAATFVIDGLELEHFENKIAVTLLTYRVKTLGGIGDFAGKERDFLHNLQGRWLVSAWEQLETENKALR